MLELTSELFGDAMVVPSLAPVVVPSLAPVVVPSLAPVVGSSGVPLNKDLRSTTLQVDLLLRHLSIEATYNKRPCIYAYKQRAVDSRDFCRVYIRIR